MTTENSFENYDKLIKQLGQAFYNLVVSEMKERPWASAFLDTLRCAEDGSSRIDKLRAKTFEGQVISLKKNQEIRMILSELSDLRSILSWYSLKLDLAHDMKVTISYSYDPKSAEDPTFYDE